MKMTEADVVWTPIGAGADTAGSIRVECHGSGWQRTNGDLWRPATSLGAYGNVPTKSDRERQLLAMFILFNTIVVRDGVDVDKAHQAFLAIDEYRQTISPDAPGPICEHLITPPPAARRLERLAIVPKPNRPRSDRAIRCRGLHPGHTGGFFPASVPLITPPEAAPGASIPGDLFIIS